MTVNGRIPSWYLPICTTQGRSLHWIWPLSLSFVKMLRLIMIITQQRRRTMPKALCLLPTCWCYLHLRAEKQMQVIWQKGINQSTHSLTTITRLNSFFKIRITKETTIHLVSYCCIYTASQQDQNRQRTLGETKKCEVRFGLTRRQRYLFRYFYRWNMDRFFAGQVYPSGSKSKSNGGTRFSHITNKK